MLIFNRMLLSMKEVLMNLTFSGLSLLLIFSAMYTHAEMQVKDLQSLSPFTLSFSPSVFNGYNISCSGGADGSIDMTIIGGTPPFTIAWSNTDTIEDIAALIAGTYVVTVIDSDGTSVTDSVTLTEPLAINISGIATNVKCNGGMDGAVDITVTNGAGGFIYLWSNLASTEDLINLSANIYSVTVTDVNFCTDTASFLVDEPLLLSIASSLVDSVNCFGGNDGAIDLIVNGGTPVYSFLWNNGDTIEDKSGLTAGTYTVTVTDQDSCSVTQSFTVRQPLHLAASIVKVNTSCGNNNGSATANHIGGTGAVTYLWSTTEVSQMLTNLPANIYSVTVTDVYGCTDFSSTTINNSTSPSVTSFVIDSVTCFGDSVGSINITISGGNPAYTYLWNDGDTIEDRTGLSASTYTVTVTDQSSCTIVESYTVEEPSQLTASIIKADATCGSNNGIATANHLGGTGGVTYLWSTTQLSQAITNLSPNPYTVTITDIHNCTATSSTNIITIGGPAISLAVVDSVNCFGGNDGAIDITVSGGTPTYSFLWNDGDTNEDRTGLSIGNYTVNVTDQNSCTTTQSYTVKEPLQFTPSIIKVDATCGSSNGSATANHVGGTGGVTYLWSTSAVSQTISGLAPNTYTVIVTDIHNCTSTSSTNIINISGPSINSSAVDSVNCFGGNDGAINITVSGGTPTYSFLWNDGNTNEDRTGLSIGNYTVTVTDQNSCTIAQSYTVKEPLQLTTNIIKVDATCGSSNGSATANHVGGTGGVTYLWSTTEVSQTIINLSVNTYTVTITDINNCTSTSSTSIINISGPTINSSVVDSVNCFGGNDGAINITVSGGIPTYSFLWDDGDTNEDRTGLLIGNYTVTVTDQNSCTTTQSFSVKQPLQLTSSILKVDATCGNNNGSATANSAGGTGGISYLWSTSAVSQTISSVAPNTYTVTVTDIHNCTSTSSTNIININGPSINSAVVDSVNCFGGSDGSIDITISGGTPTYSFLWNDGNTNEDRTGLAIGTYTVTITDQNSCTTAQSFTVRQPLLLTVSIIKVNATCGNNNGSATANSVGGTGAVTYLWSTSAITQTITALGANTYTVTLTDQNGCIASSSTTILDAGNPSIVSFVLDSVNCFGGSDGSINITVSGGTPTYNYLWNNGNTNEDRTGLAASNYTVTVTDQNSCTASQSFVIGQPTQLTVNITKNNTTCGNSNGNATANPTGGTGGLTYLWNTTAITKVIANLSVNTYTVTVTDIYNCTASASTNINNANGPSIISVIVDSVVCFGQSNGNINITVSGGLPVYSFIWNDGNTNEDRTGLSAGNYTVTVTDQNSCTVVQSYTVFQPTLLTVSITKNNATCGVNNGSETANALGGTGGVTYLWSNALVTQTIINLSANTYTVTVTDKHSCTASTSAAIINTGSPAITLVVVDSVNCFGGNDGSINITVSGGVPAYSFLWNDGNINEDRAGLLAGTYTVTITDQNSCTTLQSFIVRQPLLLTVSITSNNAICGNNNGSATANVSGGTGGVAYLWNTTAVSQTISGLGAGIYTVTVTDRNSCTSINTKNIISIPAPIAVVTSVINVLCFGDTTGAINISVSGGTPPLTYNWSSAQTTEDITNIKAGNYLMVVTDFIGCVDSLLIPVTQPLQIDIQETITPAVCGDSTGSISINIIGGTPSYSYSWSNGQTTSGINNIYAGNYTLTVTDNFGCTKTSSIGVGNIDGPQISLSSHQMVACNGGNNGFITVNISMGTPLYNYLWSNGDTTRNIINIPAGIYNLKVTDQLGCIGVFSDTITEPLPLTVSAILNNATCFIPNGSIIVTPSGGTPIYSYLWSNGVMSSTNAFIYADTIYALTLTDANLCIFDTSFTVSNTGAPVISLVSGINVSCFGLSDGAIDIDVTGGVPPYSYLWSGQLQVTQDIQNLPIGGYDVLVVDTTGCSSTAHFEITEPTEIIITFLQLNNANCGQSNGSIFSSASGGTPNYSWQWSNGAVNDSIYNLDAGSYTLTITDSTGCTQSEIANISDLDGPHIVNVDSALVSCPGGSNGSISIVATGGVPPLNYSWTNVSSNSSTIVNLPANIYTVIIADSANCIVVRSIEITDPPDFVINASLSQNNPPFNLTCFHSIDGSIDIDVTGGTTPYLYIWSTGSNNEDQINITAGSYTVIIRDSNNCQITDTFALTEPPQITAFAGSDLTICGQSYYTLDADSPAYGNGHWEVLNGNGLIRFTDSTYFGTYVDSLQPDNNIFLWIVSDGKCSASDEVILTVRSQITAFAGSDKSDLCDDSYILTGTIQQNGPDIKYYWTVLGGGGALDDSSKANSKVTGLNVGENLFLWTYINGGCTDVDSLVVNKLDSIECLTQIEIPSAISPNGDGHNDYFIIKGIEDYFNNQLTVFNRWGTEVYSKHGYKNEWNGENEGGYQLPDGTYFYFLSIKGSDRVYKGFIDIRR